MSLTQAVRGVLVDAFNQPRELAVLPKTPTIEQIIRLEDALLQFPQVDLSTKNLLSGRVYARTIFIPAGTALTGAVHLKDHINVVNGDITVWTEDGMKRLTGYHVLPTRAGAKRAGYAHEDTYWTSLIYTEETELERIEQDITPEADRLQTRNLQIGHSPLKTLENPNVTGN
jgi:hypothetical protein